jgi:hypothetical protein
MYNETILMLFISIAKNFSAGCDERIKYCLIMTTFFVKFKKKTWSLIGGHKYNPLISVVNL